MGRNRNKIRIVKKRKVDKIMEEKKVKLSTVIIFLLLIVIIAGGVYIYKLQAKETEVSNKPSENTNTSINEEIPNKTTEDKDVVKNEDFTEQEKLLTQNSVLLVGLLYKMCQVKLVKKTDNESREEVNKEETSSAKKKTSKKCNACSLKDICIPALNKKKSVSGYIDRIIAEEEKG